MNTCMEKILIPLPDYGFDPTEVAIPWKILSGKGFDIIFTTQDGKKASADIKMLKGESLGIFKSTLQARGDAVKAYSEMEEDRSFQNPLKYFEAEEENFKAIILPGGHDKGVREYLESKILQELIVDFFNAEKIVGAICHGTVLVARSIDPETKKSVINNFKTTSLLKSQELLAYNLTRLWLKDYYLTYPGLTVEDEVKDALGDRNNFIKGPVPVLRDDFSHLKRGFFVRDRNYLSARWPGDVYNFSLELFAMLNQF
jgi:protease I